MKVLGILALVSLVLSAAGFFKYVYFISLGYGFSVAGIAASLLIIYRNSLTPWTIVLSIALICYGVRLGGFLVLREIKNASYKKHLNNETKTGVNFFVKCAIWVTCVALYVCQVSPLAFRLGNATPDNVLLIVGTIIAICGILLELFADIQKAAAKKKDAHKFVSTGLYRIVRCPNYFGEVLLWTGVFVSGITSYNVWWQWVLSALGYAGIIYVMFSGARRLELRQDKNYGEDPEYQKYVKTTPILIPFLPIYSVKKLKWLVA